MQLTNLTPEIITEINVPKQMIRIQGDNIRIFALDARTIGLSNVPPDFWPGACLWEKTIPVLDDGDAFSIILPNEIVNFYQPVKIDISGDLDQTRIIAVVNAPEEDLNHLKEKQGKKRLKGAKRARKSVT